MLLLSGEKCRVWCIFASVWFLSSLRLQVWLNSYPSSWPHHSKSETNPEVVVPFQTVQEAFPLRITADRGIRLWRWQPALWAKDLKAMGLGVGHTQSIIPAWITTDNLTTFITIDWSSSRGNTDDGSLVSCPAHGLYTGHESEEAGWSHSYGLGWTVAAAAGRTGNVWMSPRQIKKHHFTEKQS